MRALTVRQPWAHAIIHQGKTVENRSWLTKYRGLLAIHTSKTLDTAVTYHADAPNPPALADLRFGEVIGTVRLLDCHHASECANAAPELQEGEFCSLWAFP